MKNDGKWIGGLPLAIILVGLLFYALVVYNAGKAVEHACDQRDDSCAVGCP